MNAFSQPLRMAPVFSERPWGGRRLAADLGKALPEGERPIGESWELSDHPNGRSTIVGGPFNGQRLGDVLRAHPAEMIGRPTSPDRYPLLVKFLDCREDLSIQVHPDDDRARARGDRGKTECWYVMEADAGAEVIFGLKPGVTIDQLRAAAADKTIDQCVARRPVERGSFLYVRAGTVHALLGGTLVAEIQQSSDTTYRLWDWNRQPARELHIEESLAVIQTEDPTIAPFTLPDVGVVPGPTVLVDNEFFRVTALDLYPGRPTDFPPGLMGSGLIVLGVEGEATLTRPGRVEPTGLRRGDTLFIPAAAGTMWTASSFLEQPARLLIAESREL